MNSSGKWLMIIFVFLAFHCGCAGQSPKPKVKVYITIVTPPVVNGPRPRGALLEVTDSSITILSKGEPKRISSDSIMSIKFKRKGAVGRGAAIGGATGLCLGMSLILAEGTEELAWIAAGGLVLSAPATIIGVIIGAASSKQRIRINGDLETFQSNHEVLKKYAYPE